jgi:thymidylate synthase
MNLKADTLDDLMRRAFKALLAKGRAIKPSRGPAVELIGVVLQLANPRARLSRSESRGHVFSALGELLWYLAKTDELDFIKYYISRYAEYSDDGRTVHGAYGPRFFAKSGIDQVANVIDLLRTRADSRRAVIQLFDAMDLLTPHADVPCTCTMQFLQRDRHLNLIVNMRSTDAVLGLPHDVFAFTMIQELIARSVGAEIGEYYHMVGSLHLYDQDRNRANEYLREGWQSTTPMPSMPKGSQLRSIEKLLTIEHAIRTESKFPRLSLGPYWRDLVRLLQIFRMMKEGNATGIAQLERGMHSKAFAPYIRRQEERAQVKRSRRHTERVHA